MTPVVELDAAVLKAMGWTHHPRIGGEGAYWRERFDSPNGCQSRFMDMPDERDYFSTDPNGHEALRLCGPWLREHTLRWGISQTNDGKTYAFGAVKHWAAHVNDVDGIGKAICDLVLAVAEREGT